MKRADRAYSSGQAKRASSRGDLKLNLHYSKGPFSPSKFAKEEDNPINIISSLRSILRAHSASHRVQKYM